VVTLSWTDNASNESGFNVERTMDAGATWAKVTTLSANVTTFTESVPLGSLWSYRVNAYNAQYTSAYTNSVTVNNPVPVTPPTAPSTLITSMQNFTATLSWKDNSNNETGFTLQRSSDLGATWTDLATTGANVTSYQDWLWQ